MRILHVLGKLDRGGAETWLMQALRHVDRGRYEMDFLVHTPEPGAYDCEARALGSRVIPCPDPQDPLRYSRNFWRALRQFGPYDVVHSHVHHHSGVVLALSAAAGVRVRVATAHNDTRMRERQRASVLRILYLRTMERAVTTFATGGTAVSSGAAESLYGTRWHLSHRWMVSHLGTDLARFDQPVNAAALRRELGIPASSIVVGHVGRFDAQKNHEYLVDIATEFARLEPRAHFLLVGDGSLRRAVEEKIGRSGLSDRFHLLGVRNDVPRLLCGAVDLFLFPSRHEGLPIALLEAQAAGLPCLVSDQVTRECDVITELIEHERLEANAEEWARKLSDLAGRRRLATAEVRKRLSYWSIEASVGRLLAFYERMAWRAEACEPALSNAAGQSLKWLRSR